MSEGEKNIPNATNDGMAYSAAIKGTSTYHVMILEHGLTGNCEELGYVKEAIERAYEGSSEKKDSNLLVYSAKCNEKNSLDGIEAGGLGLAKEINDVIREIATVIAREYEGENCSESSSNSSSTNRKIALSFIGNSLGGLYGRFALKYIDWKVPVNLGSTATNLDVLPHIFATIATPHLGIKGMTYFKVPEFLEPLAAVMYGQSGSDLFRRSTSERKESRSYRNCNDPEMKENDKEEEQLENVAIIERLSLDPQFLIPLSRFSRRIAYANAFSTDIAVPTATAAFLFDDDCIDAPDISIPQENASLLYKSRHSSHVFVPEFAGTVNNMDMTRNFQEDNDETQYDFVRFDTTARRDATNLSHTARIPTSTSEMARNLDSLGWSKVFIDARPHIPSIWKRPSRQWNKSRRSSFEDFVGSETSALKEKNPDNSLCFSSGVLKRHLSGNGFDGNTLPFGHSFLVASTRDPVHKMLYKGGRPFVDRVIAQKIVNEMLLCSSS